MLRENICILFCLYLLNYFNLGFFFIIRVQMEQKMEKESIFT